MINLDQLDSPQMSEDSSSVIGGVVNNMEANLLQPSQAAYLLNLRATIDGRRVKRNGVASIGVAGAAMPLGLLAFEVPLLGIKQLTTVVSGKAYRTPGNYSYFQIGCSASFCNTMYGGVMGRGFTNTAALFLHTAVPMTDNASLPFGNLISIDRNFAATEINIVRPRSLAWFQSRLWALNSCQTTHGSDYLIWSKVLNGNDWSSGMNVQIESDTGDQGMLLAPTRDKSPRMFIFKERSVHLLDVYWKTDGYYTTTADQLDFTESQLRPITLETGCVSTRGAVWSPGLQSADLLFLSREGIRSLNRSLSDDQGGAGLPLSYRIQPTIDRINWRMAERATAAYWDGACYFAVPIDGSIENNFVIAYDIFRDNFFFLDWRVGAWAPCQLTSQRKFFFSANAAYTDTLQSGVSFGYHLYETDTGHIDPAGSPITYEEHTRAFAFDLEKPGDGLKNRKRWRWLELATAAASTVCTLGVYYKIDEDDQWLLQNYIAIDPLDSYPILPVQLPFNFATARVIRKKLSLHNLRPGYKIQIRLLDNTSFAGMKITQLALVATPYGVIFD